MRRQFVNFIFHQIDPAWRRLPPAERESGKKEFVEAVEESRADLMIYSYSTLGLKADADFMFWRIGYSLEAFQAMSARLCKTSLGAYLRTPYSFLAMTKHSQYVDRHSHPGQEGRRAEIVPGEARYLFVYPFVKTREWYLLPQERRQEMMNVHIEVGHRYPSVKLNTTYSFGLDDQEFVVAFETDKPEDFLDLVMELRGTEGSRYTLRDTPIFTCVRKDLSHILNDLG